MKVKTILAIDFDQTLVHCNNFPHIEGLRRGAKKYINKLYDKGHYIIIWTCRTDESKIKAIEYLNKEGIKFHQINENHSQLTEFFKNDCRKISADFYVDDKGLWLFKIPSWFWLYWVLQWKFLTTNKRLLNQFK